MVLGSIETWPSEVLSLLRSEHRVLVSFAEFESRTLEAYLNPPGGRRVAWAEMPSNPFYSSRASVAARILVLLQSTPLRGWHCTRLTESEVGRIWRSGLKLPNLQRLQERVSKLERDGAISSAIARRLRSENQAGDDNRAGMIWFCFTPPCLAGQHGVERFFRHWGGETLYNSHEDDAETSEVLARIGFPCLVEVDLPIAALRPTTSLADNVIRRYMLSHGIRNQERMEHDDNTEKPVAPERIVRFIRHGEREFAELTGCEDWVPPL